MTRYRYAYDDTGTLDLPVTGRFILATDNCTTRYDEGSKAYYLDFNQLDFLKEIFP